MSTHNSIQTVAPSDYSVVMPSIARLFSFMTLGRSLRILTIRARGVYSAAAFRLCVLPSCGLLKGTVHAWVSGVWKAKQQEVGQRIGRRLERWREMRMVGEERERLRLEESESEVDAMEMGHDGGVELSSERQQSSM